MQVCLRKFAKKNAIARRKLSTEEASPNERDPERSLLQPFAKQLSDKPEQSATEEIPEK
jgi:hypothetical protein